MYMLKLASLQIYGSNMSIGNTNLVFGIFREWNSGVVLDLPPLTQNLGDNQKNL